MHAVNTPERHRFQDVQYAFAAYIRAPDSAAAPHDVPPRRMAVYAELFFANVAEQLATAFPVLHATTTTEYWDGLCRSFFADHQCTSPFFHELPSEFLNWLESEHTPAADDPPYLLELAHYEWAELALTLSADELPPREPLPHDVMGWTPRLSPLAWPLAYGYAVHRIGQNYQPTTSEATATYLLVYRDRQDQVGFMELNRVSARLLQLIGEHGDQSCRAHLQQIASELQQELDTGLQQAGISLLQQLHQLDIVL